VTAFRVDKLPPKCGVEGDIDLDEHDTPLRVRFRAVRTEEHPDGPAASAWSWWFRLPSERIELAWDAFDWDEWCGCDDTMRKYEHCPSCGSHVGPEGSADRCPHCQEELQ
jgi:hypothetical protein